MIESKHSTREYAIKTARKFGNTLRGKDGQTAVIEDHRKRVIVMWCDTTGTTHTRAFRWSV